MSKQRLAQKILDLIKEADETAEDDRAENSDSNFDIVLVCYLYWQAGDDRAENYRRALDKIEALCKEQIKDNQGNSKRVHSWQGGNR